MSGWTDERIDRLEAYWAEGRSASEIAGLLGMGLTRNAVIGKVHRLGIAGRKRPPNLDPSAPRAPRVPKQPHPAKVKEPAAIAARRQTWPAVSESRLADELEIELPMLSPMVTLADLRASDCRWPLGDPSDFDSFRYCGAPAHSGPYCPHHKKLASGGFGLKPDRPVPRASAR